MALARPRQATSSLRWSCKRCYTVNAIDAQFCSDCGLAPQGGGVVAAASLAPQGGGVVAAASAPAIDIARTRLMAVPIALVAVAALALVGMQLIR